MNGIPLKLWFACFVAAVALASLASRAGAQVPKRSLGQAEAAFPEAFSFVQSIRELPDGRVLIADPLGQVLVTVDMKAGVADTIGREGAGPGEYRQPDAVYPLPGDSTLLIDLGNGRLTVLGPELQPGETMPIAFGEPRPDRPGGDVTLIMPRGVDERGRIYFQGTGITLGGPRMVEFADSAPIMRLDRRSQTIDTVGMIRLEKRETITSGSGANLQVEVEEFPLSPQDAWAVGWNGRVVAARSDGYYLEWIDDDGLHRGPDVPYRPVRVRRADQEEFLNRMTSSQMSMQVSVVNGVRTTAFSRGGDTGAATPRVDDYEWPDVKPPFVPGGVRVTPEGDAWVRRSVPAGGEIVIDVFGQDGVLKEQITLPAGRRVIGFGNGFVYTVTADEFDLQWLERYRRNDR